MPWTQILQNWPQLLDHLARDFSALEPATLSRFRADRAKLERYLAQTHDLTRAEAAETFQDWLSVKAGHLDRTA